MRDRYFKNVKEMIEYAADDIKRFNIFEFQYGKLGNETYNVVRSSESIKEISEDSFEFNGLRFNLDYIIPCC